MNKQQTPEMITFGETMGLLMPMGSKGLEYSPVLQKGFGGAESNVAIGVSRLGHSAGWFGTLGDDPFGHMIRKAIRGEGVDISRSRIDPQAPTGMMMREVVANKTSVYYNRAGSAASRMKPTDLDATYFEGVKILHITGITAALSASCRDTLFKAIRLAKEKGVKVCFDPNIRLKLWSLEEAREVLLALAQEADYFLPGLDELQLLYNTSDVDQVMQHLGNLPAISVIKGGGEETWLFENGELERIPYFPVDQIVDTVGAGDAFCAGFISGLLRDMPLKEAVELGSLLGAMVIQMEGDWEALPTWEEVQAVMENKQHIER